MMDKINRELLRYAIGRRITCPVTGKVLDIRRAVYYEVTNSHGRNASEVVDGTAWDGEHGEALRRECEAVGVKLDVIDGREIHGR